MSAKMAPMVSIPGGLSRLITRRWPQIVARHRGRAKSFSSICAPTAILLAESQSTFTSRSPLLKPFLDFHLDGSRERQRRVPCGGRCVPTRRFFCRVKAAAQKGFRGHHQQLPLFSAGGRIQITSPAFFDEADDTGLGIRVIARLHSVIKSNHAPPPEMFLPGTARQQAASFRPRYSKRGPYPKVSRS